LTYIDKYASILSINELGINKVLKEINDKYYFSICINNKTFMLPELEKYVRNKLMIKRIKYKTLITKISTLKNFIIWTLANPVSNDEDLILYLARYLESCENGFRVYDNIYVEELGESIEYLLLDSTPKQASTVNKDKAIIEDFLKVTNQDLFENFKLHKNIQSLNHSTKHSVHDGYGLRMGSLAQNAFSNEESIIPNKINAIQGDIKAFPYELFDELLQLAQPRERLIYLLSGACSTRASQALNLTLYDIDYTNQRVWLIDPRSNDQLGVHGVGRKNFLKNVYNINASKDKPHANIGFKAPIPLRYKERLPLFWFSNIYKNLFFQTLSEFKSIPESNRVPKHPFFFVSSTGKRLTPQQVDITFKAHCKKLKKIYPEYAVQLDRIGLHSLRHMFGVVMATFEAKIIMSGNKHNIPLDQIKITTQEAMGHKSKSSTDIYFNRPWHLNVELGEYLNKVFDTMIENRKWNYLGENSYDKKRYA
jgi:integrase